MIAKETKEPPEVRSSIDEHIMPKKDKSVHKFREELLISTTSEPQIVKQYTSALWSGGTTSSSGQ